MSTMGDIPRATHVADGAQTVQAIPIAEIFGPTIQGEGAVSGVRTMFIRTAYCDGAGPTGWCRWCDSLHAVDPKYKSNWEFLTPSTIVDRMVTANVFVKHVTISGGNPGLHDLTELIRMLREAGYEHINVETQGTVYQPWMQTVDMITMSPKPPSAGMCDTEKFEAFLSRFHDNVDVSLVLKIVVDPERLEDFQFAKDLVRKHRNEVDHTYLSTYTHPADEPDDLITRWRELIDMVCKDPDIGDVAVLPQLHVLLWGHRIGV